MIDSLNSLGQTPYVVSQKGGGTFLALTSHEKSDILAFLNLLTDSTFITNPAFSDPNQPLKIP